MFLFLHLYPLSKKKLFNDIDHGQNAFTIYIYIYILTPTPSTLYGNIVAILAYIMVEIK